MAGLRILLAFAFNSATSSAQQNAGRKYTTDAIGWSTSVYKPQESPLSHETQMIGVGLVNDDRTFVATRSHISWLHEGHAINLREVVDGEITAFHLCHHRSSLFYEVLSEDGWSIFEYNIDARSKTKVFHMDLHHDIDAATSLACADSLLLRASQSSMLSVGLRDGGEVHVLREGSDPVTSLSVRYAADSFTQAVIYGAVPSNRSVIKLRLTFDASGGLAIKSSEVVLSGGDGSDGVVGTATVIEPRLVLWVRDRLILADGCSLREMHEGRVTTTLGTPTTCAEQPTDEVIAPVPWASTISKPVMLAGAAERTKVGVVLALTASQVVRVAVTADPDAAPCASLLGEDACVEHAAASWVDGCGWAASDPANQRACLNCDGLQRWAHGDHGEVCALEGEPKAGTKYSLKGCGCDPDPDPDPDDGDEGFTIHHVRLWACLVAATLVVIVAVALFLYRSQRRAAVFEILDRSRGEVSMAEAESECSESEYHAFTDDE